MHWCLLSMFFKKEKEFPYNIDSKVWKHLGYNTLTFSDGSGGIRSSVDVHMFLSDEGKRKFYINAPKATQEIYMRDHLYIRHKLVPWVLGSGDVHEYVLFPSDLLIGMMKKVYNLEWLPNENGKYWWKVNTASKITSTESNVIQVDFGKKDES